MGTQRLVHFAALADEGWDVEVVVLHGAADGFSHAGEVWSFTRRSRDARRSSNLGWRGNLGCG
jgi:hypothetical protein